MVIFTENALFLLYMLQQIPIFYTIYCVIMRGARELNMNVVIFLNEENEENAIIQIIRQCEPDAQIYTPKDEPACRTLLNSRSDMDLFFVEAVSAGDLNDNSFWKKTDIHTVFIVDNACSLQAVSASRNIGFIQRPIEEFYVRVQIASCLLHKRAVAETVTIKMRKSTFSVPVSRILYFEGQKNSIIVHIDDNTTLKVTAKISDYYNASERLIRTHQSFIVNLDYIAEIKGAAIFLTDGTQIPISRTYIKRTRETFLHFKSGLYY